MKNPNAILFLMYMPFFASEKPQQFERVKIHLEMLYEERNKTREAEKTFLLSQQSYQQCHLEKGRKWRIKKNVNGVNFVDRGTPPTKKIKVAADCGHEDC